jgi:2-polyprenyl-3-methyl-5-hydroxy-6-metoxy-1,4-benzoquinol methylase
MQTVESYGWTNTPPPSHDYLAPVIGRITRQLGAHKVLDLGCGNGALASELAKSGFEVTGCDADAGGIENARRTYPAVHFIRAGIYDDPSILGIRGFDLIVSTEVVEHLFAPRMLPRFAAALLRPGGHLQLTTPYHGYIKNLAIALLGKWDQHHDPLWDGGHIKYWSRATLTKLLEEGPFHVTAFEGVGRLPLLWKSMVLVARKTGA